MECEVFSQGKQKLAIFHLPKDSPLWGKSLETTIITPEEFIDHIDAPFVTFEYLLGFILYAKREFDNEPHIVSLAGQTQLGMMFRYTTGLEATDWLENGTWQLVVGLTSTDEAELSPTLDEIAAIVFALGQIEKITEYRA